MSSFLTRPLIISQGRIGHEPTGFPWNTKFAQNRFDIEAWIFIYHEAAHAVLAELNGLHPTAITIAWGGGGRSTVTMPYANTPGHHEACVAGGAITAIMHEQFGDLDQALDTGVVAACTRVDRLVYANQCGGVATSFDPDLQAMQTRLTKGSNQMKYIDATALVIYERWCADCQANGRVSNPFCVQWIDVQNERRQRFGF